MTAIYATPRIPRDMVSRPRLTALLDTDAPLIIVRAPAGSGKTVAVAEWAMRRYDQSTPGVWLTVDGDSPSRQGFWAQAIQLLADAGLLRDDSILLASLPQLASAPDLRRILIRGFAQRSGELVLIFDNLHLVTDLEILQDIRLLLEAIPQLRIIALTRLRGALELDEVHIALGAVTIDTAELLFTAEETVQLVEQLGIPDPGGRLAAELSSAVGGFPLTIRGVLLLLTRENFDLDPETVRERLAVAGIGVLRDIWALQVGTDDDIDFAIRCSVPETLSIGLAIELTGRADAAAILHLAESLGVGLWSDMDADTEALFSFTPAVRSALRLRLNSRFPDEVRRLTQVTAVWHFERGDFFTALRYGVSIQDFDLVTRFITRGYTHMLTRHTQGLVDLLGALPLTTLREQPLVTLLLAMALNKIETHRIRATEMFMLASVAARIVGNRSNSVERAVLLTVENSALRAAGQVARSLDAAERTAAHFEILTLEEKDQLQHLAPALLAHTGMTFLYSGRTAKALKHFQAAYSLPLQTKAGHLHALALIAGTHAVNGDMPEAENFVDIARVAEWPDGQRSGYFGALYQVAEGVMALEALDFTKAQRHVTAMEPHFERIEHWPLIMRVQSISMMAEGRALEAATTLGADISRGSHLAITEFTHVYLDATRALLLLAAGQLRRAERVLQKHPRSHPEIATGWARLHLMLGKPEAARLALRPLNADALSSRLRGELLLLRAAAALGMGEVELALDAFEQAIALVRDRGLRMPVALLPAADRRNLVLALERSTRSSGARGMLEELERIPSLVVARIAPVTLSEREHVVLDQLMKTSSTAEIAAALFVSANTIKTQLRSIYRKLGATSREDALRRAGEQGLLRT